jgi:hypothetical protein
MLQRTLLIVSVILLQLNAPGRAQAGSPAVTIKTTSFALKPSPAGNKSYFVIVTINYAPTDAVVRFRCDLSARGAPVSLYGVLRGSGTSLRFISPFPSSTPVTSVKCFVSKTS